MGIRKIGRYLSLVEAASASLAALIVFALMLLVVCDVFGRKFFNSPIQGSIEIASLALPTVVFLTVAYIQARNEHVTVDLFTAGLNRTTQLGLNVFALGIGVLVMSVVVWKTTAAAWSSTISSEYAMGIVEVPIWPARILVALGSWLLALRFLYDLLCGCILLFHIARANDVPLTQDD